MYCLIMNYYGGRNVLRPYNKGRHIGLPLQGSVFRTRHAVSLQYHYHTNSLILFLLVREIKVLDIRNIAANGIGNHRMQVGISA